jgi:hypothetical protein
MPLSIPQHSDSEAETRLQRRTSHAFIVIRANNLYFIACLLSYIFNKQIALLITIMYELTKKLIIIKIDIKLKTKSIIDINNRRMIHQSN